MNKMFAQVLYDLSNTKSKSSKVIQNKSINDVRYNFFNDSTKKKQEIALAIKY
jgi:hypothetical protein